MVRFPFLFWFYLFNLSGWLIVWPIFLLSTGCFIEYQRKNKTLTILLEYACLCFFLLAIKLKGCVSDQNLGLTRFIVADKLFYFMYFFDCLKTFFVCVKFQNKRHVFVLYKRQYCLCQKTTLLVKQIGCCFSVNECRIKIIDLTAPCKNYSYLRPKGTITFTVDRKYVILVDIQLDGWFKNTFHLWPKETKQREFFCSINKNAKKLKLRCMTILVFLLFFLLCYH